MGNPYYIPPGDAPLTGLTRNIMALAELKQRGDLARMGQEQDAARLAADQDYRKQTLAQGAEQNAIQREELYAKNPTVKPYDSKTHVQARMAVKTLGLEGSGVEKYLDSAQEGGFNNGQVYSGLRTPQMHKQIKKYAQEQLIKGSEVAGFAGSQQEARLNDILEAIDKPEDYNAFIDGMFPDVAQYNATVEAENQRKTKIDRPYKVGQIIDKKGQGGRDLQGTVRGWDDEGQPVIDWQDVTKPKDNSNEQLIPVDNGDGTVTYTPKSQVRGLTVNKTKNQVTEKSLVDAESNILNPNAKKPEVTPYVDYFNSYSPKGYAYKWSEDKNARYIFGKQVTGEKPGWRKVTLPVVNGKQVTAKDVSDTAQARGMTYDRALTAILTLAKGKR